MSCRTSGLSDKWVVGQVGRQVNEQFDKRVVGQVHFFAILSDKWVVGQVSCRTSELSDK